MPTSSPPIFRFAPSPNGELHLGHAYSALLNQKMASESGGTLLIRIEDIDRSRCTPELEAAMLEDLRWIGVEWTETPIRQSEGFDRYRTAIDRLTELELIYHSFMSRGDIRRYVESKTQLGEKWPTDPDGSPIYPGKERDWTADQIAASRNHQPLYTLRLNMARAKTICPKLQNWTETGTGPNSQTGQIIGDSTLWGDVVLARSDTPTSYHLAVVIDDAYQGISHVVRGQDLFFATSIHVLLQTLLELPTPTYHHHILILDNEGQKLSKSSASKSIRSMRHSGMSPSDVRELIGF